MTLNRRRFTAIGLSGIASIPFSASLVSAATDESATLGKTDITVVSGRWKYDADVSDTLATSDIEAAAFTASSDIFVAFHPVDGLEPVDGLLLTEDDVLQLLTYDDQEGTLIDLWGDTDVTYAIKTWDDVEEPITVVVQASEFGRDTIVQFLVANEPRMERTLRRIHDQIEIDGDPAFEDLDFDMVQEHIDNPVYVGGGSTSSDEEGTPESGDSGSEGSLELGDYTIDYVSPWSESKPSKVDLESVTVESRNNVMAFFLVPANDAASNRAANKVVVDALNDGGDVEFEMLDRWREGDVAYALVHFQSEDGTDAINILSCTAPEDGADFVVSALAVASVDTLEDAVTEVQEGLSIDGTPVWGDIDVNDVSDRITELDLL